MSVHQFCERYVIERNVHKSVIPVCHLNVLIRTMDYFTFSSEVGDIFQVEIVPHFIEVESFEIFTWWMYEVSVSSRCKCFYRTKLTQSTPEFVRVQMDDPIRFESRRDF